MVKASTCLFLRNGMNLMLGLKIGKDGHIQHLNENFFYSFLTIKNEVKSCDEFVSHSG